MKNYDKIFFSKLGVRRLPKPREGEEALNTVLLDLMDDAVRAEVSRQKAEKNRNRESESENTSDSYSTPRQLILKEMGEALEVGNIDKAKLLRYK